MKVSPSKKLCVTSHFLFLWRRNYDDDGDETVIAPSAL